MEKKQIAFESLVSVAGITVIPVTVTSVHTWQNRAGVSFLGLKKPLFILVRRPGMPLKYFTPEGTETTPEYIVSEYPELKDRLELLSSCRL
jgi:hypothetical protein